ncbi:DUF3054 family protein [Kocuria sediminis]|uniref:DUF3054 family protein n=1 Tax=Kocuria sediminis TaxID=1038857 RepID=A0A6N8GHS4_9MICC|nr:DUF3054 domain-containing protein [Kocuria sediminis]MUN62696.1 DUF3054 family protein [Kocuria sediminis]
MHTTAPTTARRSGRTGHGRSWPAVLVLDVLLVLLFAGVGRSTHALDPVGLLETAWPFLAGLLLGWVLWRLPRQPVGLWPRGVALWLTTVSVGMGLRVLVGEGTAPSFVLVTLGVLAVLLLGHRALALTVRAARARRRP